MAYKDRPMRCNACSHRFFYTVAEQRKRAEAGMHDHTMLFCPRCKSADVVEVDLSGFSPTPSAAPTSSDSKGAPSRDQAAARRAQPPREPSPPAADEERREHGRGPARKEPTRSASSSDGERGGDSRDGGSRDGDTRDGSRRGSSRGGRGGRRGEARGGRGGKRKGGGRRGGGRGRRREREQPRQTELRVRHMGTVKWFDDDRGYGFIAQDEGGELFVHLTGLIVEGYDSLMEGTPVEYEIERTSRGPQAVDVVPLA